MGKKPCGIRSCSGLAKPATGLCAVHSKANEGPHSSKCVKCRKAVEHGQFWIYYGTDETKVAHPSCLVPVVKVKRQRRGWDNGLGSLIGRA